MTQHATARRVHAAAQDVDDPADVTRRTDLHLVTSTDTGQPPVPAPAVVRHPIPQQIVALVSRGVTLDKVAQAVGEPEAAVRRRLHRSLVEAGLGPWPRRMAVLLRLHEEADRWPFSPRERQIAELIHAGQTLEEIAATLQIAVGTVRAHLHRALARRDVAHSSSGMRARLCQHLLASDGTSRT